MRLALFQPDIPQNLGAAIRLAACLGVGLDVVEPCGFPLSDRAVRRAALDYVGAAEVRRHASWEAFRERSAGARLVLLTTRGAVRHTEFGFEPSDVLLVGRESAGVPETVHATVDARVRIALAPGARSLNVVVAAAMALGEAQRQTVGP